jgi:PLD-like domain
MRPQGLVDVVESLLGQVLDGLCGEISLDRSQRLRAVRLLRAILQRTGVAIEPGQLNWQVARAELNAILRENGPGVPAEDSASLIAGLEGTLDRLSRIVLLPHRLSGVLSTEALNRRRNAVDFRAGLVAAGAVPDEILLLPGEEYSRYLLKEFGAAKSRIVVGMGEVVVTNLHAHPTRALIMALGHAVSRSVKVEFFTATTQGAPLRTGRSTAVSELKRSGVAVYSRLAAKPFHHKVVTIDDAVVVIGSHNWTLPSLIRNYEVSVAIRSHVAATQAVARVAHGFSK